MSLKHSTIKSFSYAYDGVKAALKKEPNFRLHILFALLAIILGLYLELSFVELAVLAITIWFVLILELINTTLEAIVNLVSPKIRPHAKMAKDVSAAAVLFSAILSVIIGILLFLPKIIMLL
jgi:diacylglycerol kinase